MSNTEVNLQNTKLINSNFRIKVHGKVDDHKLNILVGVSGLVDLVGEDLASKMVERAFTNITDSCVCKLRRGLKITFYNK